MKIKYHRQLNRFIRKQLRKRGFLIRRISMLDRREVCNDPRQILYFGTSYIIINVPVEKGRRKIFPVTADWDPFYCALKLSERNGGDKQILQHVLRSYYSKVQPENALQWIGLEYEDAPRLAQTPPWAAPPPWTDLSIKEVNTNVNADMLHDSGHGDRKLTLEQGWAHCGPVAEDKIKLEVERLYIATDSIKSLGYDRNFGPGGDIGAKFLINEEGGWRWLISPGNHRIAIVSALGYTEIPVLAKSLVFRRDVDIWPNVLSGLYTRKGALKYFDNLFQGNIPEIMQPWAETARGLLQTNGV